MIRRVCWGIVLILSSWTASPVAAQTDEETTPTTPATPTTQVVQTRSFLVEYAIVGGLAGLALFAVCKSSRRV